MPRHPPNAHKNKQTKHAPTTPPRPRPQEAQQHAHITKNKDARVHYTVHNQPTHTRPRPTTQADQTRQGPRAHCPRPRQRAKPPTHHQPTTPPPTPTQKGDQAPAGRPPASRHSLHHASHATPHPSPPKRPGQAGGHKLPRKEVIQPHLPVRLPCYDFVPITSPTFDRSHIRATGFGCCRLS